MRDGVAQLIHTDGAILSARRARAQVQTHSTNHRMPTLLLILIGAHASLSLRRTAPTQYSPRLSIFRRRLDAPRSCICINCKWIDRCEVYHWVEKQHEQPHVTDSPDFEPVEPQGAQPWPA